MKDVIRNTPIIGRVARKLRRLVSGRSADFTGSGDYWTERYKAGGNSGDGSYGALSEFKAETLNRFVREHAVETVIEYGCGDGNQLGLAEYPCYTGFDVSPDAIARCRDAFGTDASKTFALVGDYAGEAADLTLSLDVVYHLVEDAIFEDYMARLFDSSKRFVIVYSSNTDENPEGQASHVRHRKFSDWIARNRPEWSLRAHIPNRYPVSPEAPERGGSFADFYVFERGSPVG